MVIQTIGDFLPAAVAVALSPIPIVAVVLMLGTPRARSNGPAFALGWVAGLVAVSIVVVVVLGGSSQPGPEPRRRSTGSRSRSGRSSCSWPRGSGGNGRRKERIPPCRRGSLDRRGHAGEGARARCSSGANPKNLALTAAAAASIAQAGLDGADTAIAIAAFVVIGSLTVVGSVLYYLIDADRAAGPLAGLKEFMLRHNAVIMMVLLLVLGAKILGDGAAAL